MRRFVLALTAAGFTAACGPAPLSGADAALVLESFVAGGADAADVCTPSGRSLLRNAVRSYGAAMAENGQDWPAIAEPDQPQQQLNPLDVTVMVSVAAGFVKASDLPGAARGRAQRLMLGYLPDMIRFRTATMDACDEVVALQRAASRYAVEMERYRHVIDAARRSGGEGAAARLLSQNAVLQSAEAEMQRAVAVVDARMRGD